MEIQISDVQEFIVWLHQSRNFRFAKVTFDGWNCCAAGTLVLANRGIIPIEKIKVGDIVQTRSGPRYVEKTWAYGHCPTIRLTTQHGDVFEATGNHKIEVMVGHDYKRMYRAKRDHGDTAVKPVWRWKRLDEITCGDVIRLWDQISEVDSNNVVMLYSDTNLNGHGGKKSKIYEWHRPSEMTVDFAEWLGLVWGDGHISGDFVSITLHKKNVNCANRLIKRLFGTELPFRVRGENHGVINISSRSLVRWMRLNDLYKPYIPDAVMKSSKRVRAAFLKGLFAADGNVKKRDGQVSLSTIHRKLADQVRIILMEDWGITSNLLMRSNSYRNGCKETDSDEHVVSIRGERRRFLNNIGFTYQSKQDLALEHVDVVGRRIFSKVLKIEYSSADVFDIAVDGDHSYLANGIVSHNSLGTIQTLTAMGYLCERDPVANSSFDTMIDLWYDDRLDIFEDVHALWELRKLEKKANGKIEKSIGSSDDEIECLAKVCELCVEGELPEIRKPRARGMTAMGMSGKPSLPNHNMPSMQGSPRNTHFQPIPMPNRGGMPKLPHVRKN
jgi:hypothetical protein